MLPKKYRFSLRKQKKRYQPSVGVRYPGDLFNLVVYEQKANAPQPLVPQFAFVVSGRFSKKAVVRNRARRLLSEGVQPFLNRVKPQAAVVIIGKQSLLVKNLGEIRQELEKIFKNAGLIIP